MDTSERAVHMETVTCQHHWDCPEPDGESWVTATCRKCGEVKAMYTSYVPTYQESGRYAYVSRRQPWEMGAVD